MKISFATGNPHKLKEANEIGRLYGIGFEQLKMPYSEIRDEDVGKVAEAGALYVYSRTQKPVVVDDTGLYIGSLRGFPGPYSAYVYKTIGCGGILNLLPCGMDRTASFVSAVAYADGDGARVFRGEVKGSISPEERGDPSFGYDPIFVPAGEEKTFAEDPKTKFLVSHRRKSFESFCKWAKENLQR